MEQANAGIFRFLRRSSWIFLVFVDAIEEQCQLMFLLVRSVLFITCVEFVGDFCEFTTFVNGGQVQL